MTDRSRAPHRRTAVVVLVLIIGIGVGIWLLRGSAKRFALSRLTSAVEEHLGGGYDFHIGEFSLRPLSGEILISGMEIIPTRGAVDTVPRAEAGNIYTVRSGEVNIRLARPLLNLLRRRLEIRRITVDAPSVEIFSHGAPENDTLSPAPPRGFSSPFRSIAAGRIELHRGRFSYSLAQEKDTLRCVVADVYIGIGKLALDSIFDLRSLPAMEQLHLKTAKISLSPAGEGLTLEVTGMRGELDARTLAVDSLRLIPLYGKREFPLRTSGKDWMALTVGRMALTGSDLRGVLDGRGLRADSLVADGVVIESFKNRRISVPQREKPLLHRLLQKIPIPLAIRVVQVSESRAVYEELPVGDQIAGRFFMDGISARIDSLTNIAPTNDHLDIRADARVMGRGALKISMEFPLREGDDNFTISATLGSMPMSAFNPMIEPLGHIGVQAGRLRRLEMTMEGDARNGVVNMRMAYDSLSVSVLNKQGLRSWLGSAAVNALVLKSTNPEPGEELQEVHAQAARDPYRSNFNYWWRIAFAGVKESVGLTDKRQSRIASLQEMFREMKARREERRAKRQ